MGQSLGASVCALLVGLGLVGNLWADSPSPLADPGKPHAASDSPPAASETPFADADSPFADSEIPADDPFADGNVPQASPQQPVAQVRPAAQTRPTAEKVLTPATRPTAELPPTAENPAVAAARRIDNVLDQPLRAPLQFVAMPLNQVMHSLAEDYDIPVQFDVPALDAVAASPEVEVTASIANVSLRSALDLLLRNAGAEQLTYIIDNEVLLITTQEEAEKRLEVVVYRVDDLVSPDASRAELQRLIDIIIATVEQESWMVNNTGEGEIHALEPAMLIVAQTQRVHRRLVSVLAEVRRTKTSIEQTRSQQPTSQTPVTRALRLNNAANSTPENRKILEQSLRQSVDWNVGDKGVPRDDVFLHVLSDRVLVRHTPAVVRQVEEAIQEVALTPPRARARQFGRGRGGF